MLKAYVNQFSGLTHLDALPLAAGLVEGWSLIQRALNKDRRVDPVLVLISDCRANVGSRPGYPAILAEIDRICAAVRNEPRLRVFLFDATEDGKNDSDALRLAEAAGARTLKVHRIRGLEDEELRALLRGI